jgi:hypothetical protein
MSLVSGIDGPPHSEWLALYTAAKRLSDFPKVSCCLFNGTSLEPSMAHLSHYNMEGEVTQAVFQRGYSAFMEKCLEKGCYVSN